MVLDEASDCNSAATLLGQPGPQRGPLPHVQLGPLPGLLGGRTRLRSQVCSRVVGENINTSAQQRI